MVHCFMPMYLVFYMFFYLLSILLISFLLVLLYFLIRIYAFNLFSSGGIFSTVTRTSFITATFWHRGSRAQWIHLRGLFISWDTAG